MPPRLPEFYAITPPLKADGTATPILEQRECRKWLARFEQLLASDIELFQLRAKALSGTDLGTLAGHCQRLAETQRSGVSCRSGVPAAIPGARLLLNGPPGLAADLGMGGVHLTSRALMKLTERPLPGNFLIGASCHCAEELAHAEAIGADFACLSPVKPTKGYGPDEVLGFSGFAARVAGCAIPVYALGGLRREDLNEVLKAGGQGVAGISAFFGVGSH